jgi:hypothetical protein
MEVYGPLEVQPITNQSIQTAFIQFCQEERFKTYVHNAIDNELFWRGILQRYQLDSQVESKMNSYKTALKQDIKDSVNIDVNNKLQNYTHNSLPGNITKELQNQVPLFLSNNHQMQNILGSHILQLQNELSSVSRQILDKITNEEKYQTVTASHLNSMSMRYNESVEKQLSENTMKFDKQIILSNDLIDTTLKRIASNADTAMEKVNNFNTTISTLTTKIGILEMKLEKVKNQYTAKDYLLIVWGTGMTAFCTYLFWKK